jgi:predicted ATPase/DNA-binding XRE family transcriptional regulator/exonuclease VII small subunit
VAGWAGMLACVGKGRFENGPAGSGESFAERLRSLREAAGLTQEELALRAGLSPSAVGVLERGARKRPYPHTVRALAEALDLSEEERASLLATVPKRGETTPSAEVVSPTLPDLPHPATSLVGREREVEEASNLLTKQDVRLLTFTGTGGVGKTRLATEVARAAGTAFPGGVAFVGLAPLGDAALVLPTIARALGLKEFEDRSPEEVLADHLRAKSLLLVLDNFEHLLDAAARVAGLIETCPFLVVLATSRAPLRVRGEREYPVPPLALPTSTRSPTRDDVLGSPSVRLFLDRARAVAHGFEITRENASPVAAICWRLAGLPLALELAAAKVRYLEPAALLSRLDLALSSGWARDVPERQRTVRATMAWSEDLLGEEERTLFRRLSVFAGGFTIESAEAIGAAGGVGRDDVLGLLGDLVEQSLVIAGSAPQGRRYEMLEPVRQYASEKLEVSGEAIATRERHAEYFLALAEAARGFLLGPEHEIWSGRLEQEHDNLREALRWARDAGDVCGGLRLAGALSWFWWMQGYLDEGRRWTEVFLSEPFADDRPRCCFARAAAFYGAGELAFGQGDLDRASELFERALALYRRLDDNGGVAVVLAELGQVVRAQGDHDRAAALSREGLDLAHSLSDPRIAAIALSTLGRLERHRCNLEEAIVHYEESLALFREVGHRWGSAYVLAHLAIATLESGELERALALNEESLSIYADLGDKSGMALVLINLGDMAREQGEEGRALALYNDALAMYRELGNERGVARALGRLARGSRAHS